MFSPPFASAKAGGGFPFRRPSTTAFWKCQRFGGISENIFLSRTQKCPVEEASTGRKDNYFLLCDVCRYMAGRDKPLHGADFF
jgi:hypothetical protein